MKNKKIVVFGLALVLILLISAIYITTSSKSSYLDNGKIIFGDEDLGHTKTEELLFDLERVDIPIELTENYETNEKMLAYASNSRDHNFFIALVLTDFNGENLEYYISYLPQNVEKLSDSEHIEYFRSSRCTPHHATSAGTNKFYVFTYGECNYFYKYDLENMEMEVIIGETLGLDSVISFVDTAFEEDGIIYLSTLEEENGERVNRWYIASTDLSRIEKIYESYEAPAVHHSTRFFKGLILSVPFSYRFSTSDGVVFNSFSEFTEHVYEETGVSGVEVRRNPYKYLSEFEFKMLPDTLIMIDPDKDTIQFYNTSASLAGHLEEFKGKMYVSNHNFLIDSRLGVYFISPATIDKFEYLNGEMFLSDSFVYEYGFRYTSHVLNEFEGMDYLVTIAYPNRLLIVDTDDMSIYRKLDIGTPYIEKAEEENYSREEFLKLINNDIGNSYRNSMLALETIENGEKIVLVSGNGNVYVYSLALDEIIDEFSLSPTFHIGTTGTYSIIPHHVNIV